jgi:hypothetical protein
VILFKDNRDGISVERDLGAVWHGVTGAAQ